MNTSLNASTTRDSVLARLMEDYLASCEAGQPLSDAQLAARYPELSEDVAACLASLKFIRQATRNEPTKNPLQVQSNPIGDYELVEEIGRGGMGIVYRARQLPLPRCVALKMIRAGHLASTAEVERFRAEAESAASLDHPHIVPIYEVGQHEGQPYFSMKLIEGGSLADARTRENSEFKIQNSKLESSARLIATVADAVHYAHQRGILHRDLKPSNILLDRDGQPYVTDFGLAKRFDVQESLTGTGDIIGTPLYMAPEQAAGQKHLTTAADIYSLGAILYGLLTGRPAINATTPLETLRQVQDREPTPLRSLNAHVDRDLETICLKCLEKDPLRRYPSAAALAEDLQRWLAREPILARPLGRSERFYRCCRKSPAIAGLVTIVIFVAAAGLFGVFNQWQLALASEQKAVANEQKANDNAVQAKANEQEATKERDEAQKQRDEAERQKNEAQRKRDEVRAINEKLLATQQKLQSTLYAAHINLAQQAWEGGSVERVLQFLDQHRPRPGEPDLRGFEWHYLNRLCHAGEVSLVGHTARITDLAFSTDGKRIATASADHIVKIWDTSTGKELLTVQSQNRMDEPVTVAFSPDGQLVAMSGNAGWGARGKLPGDVVIWNAQTGAELARLKDTGSRTLALSPDNKRLATASAGSIKTWNIETGEQTLNIKITDKESQWIGPFKFSPDGKRLATGIGNDDYVDERGQAPPADVSLWDAQTGALLHSMKGHTRYISSLAFQPDGKRLATGSESGPLRVWDTETGVQVLTLGRSSEIGSIVYSPDGNRVAAVLADSTIKTWDAATGQEVGTFMTHGNPYLALAADGRCLSALRDNQTVTLKVWDLPGQAGRIIKTSNLQNPGALTFSPDGKLLATPGVVVQVWDVATGQEFRALKGHTALSNNQAFSPDGKRLATASRDRTAKVWDLQTGQELTTLTGHTGAVAGIRFRPDGKQLATASWDGTAKIWDAETWKELYTLKQAGMAYGLTYSPDGKQLCVGSLGVATIWDPETGRVIRSLTARGLQGEQGECVGLAYSPDGRQIAGGCGKLVFIWDAQSGRQLRTLVGAIEILSRVAYSPDGKRLAAGSWDRTLRLWDVENGIELLSFNPSSFSVAFSPSGHFLAISRPQGGVEILDGTPLPDPIMHNPEAAANRFAVFSQSVAASRLPNGWWMGWRMNAQHPFTAGVDADVRHGGAASGFIERNQDHPTASIGMNQTVQVGAYAGKRVRLAAYVKTLDANRGARLMLYATGETMSVRDYMDERQITGTTDWTRHEIVVDVPKDAPTIHFGFELTGKGRVWADDFQLEVVGDDVPTTKQQNATLPQVRSALQQPGLVFRAEPINLDFEGTTTLGSGAQVPLSTIAEGWASRSILDGYDIGLDRDVFHGGKSSAFIKSKVAAPSRLPPVVQSFQSFRADDYRGKRLRLSGYVKANNVADRASFWMLVEGETSQLAYDNMQDRPITGTVDWKIHDIVLDIPETAVNITLAISMSGTGQVWFDDFQLEVVGEEFPTTSLTYPRPTGRKTEPTTQTMPQNLDFER